MKILIVDNSSVAARNGKYYTNALNGIFLDELISQGNRIIYYQFAINSSNNISSFNLEEHGVRCIVVPYNKNKLINYALAYLRVIKVIKTVDFVYLYYPNSFKYVGYLCKLLKKPFGMYVRGMIGVEDHISQYLYKQACTIFTVSDFFTNMVNKITQRDVAHTIRPMIPYTDADVVVGREYKSKEVYKVLFLGRIDKEKGLVELLNAVKYVRDKGYLFVLQVVGNGEFSPQMNQMVADLKLNDIVKIEGPVYDNEKKAAYYKEADLYILPTYHEGFPRTLYEAMIFGTPIITTFVGGIPALMKDEENCKRIEPKSEDSIVEALMYAMDNYNTMGEYAQNASKMVAGIVDKNRPSHAQHLHQILKNI